MEHPLVHTKNSVKKKKKKKKKSLQKEKNKGSLFLSPSIP